MIATFYPLALSGSSIDFDPGIPRQVCMHYQTPFEGKPNQVYCGWPFWNAASVKRYRARRPTIHFHRPGHVSLALCGRKNREATFDISAVTCCSCRRAYETAAMVDARIEAAKGR